MNSPSMPGTHPPVAGEIVCQTSQDGLSAKQALAALANLWIARRKSTGARAWSRESRPDGPGHLLRCRRDPERGDRLAQPCGLLAQARRRRRALLDESRVA